VIVTGVALPIGRAAMAAPAACLPDIIYTEHVSDSALSPVTYVKTNCGTVTKRLGANVPQVSRYGAAWSPDGHRIAFGGGDEGMTSEIYVTDLRTDVTTQLTHLGGYNATPSWSPDGKKLAFYHMGATAPIAMALYTVSVDTPDSAALLVNMACKEMGSWPVWSHAGTRIIYPAEAGTSCDTFVLKGITPDGSNNQVLVTTGKDLIEKPVLSLDDRYVFYSGSNSGNQLWKVDLQTGEASQVTAYPRSRYFNAKGIDSSGNIWVSGQVPARGIGWISPTNPTDPQIEMAGDFGVDDVYSGAPTVPPSTTTTVPSSSPTSTKPNKPLKVVALGDSYSSGEGAPPFLNGTDAAGNKCHRSSAAYPEVIFGSKPKKYNLSFHACSGAMIEDFFSPNQLNAKENKAQLDWLTPDTDVVTLSAGGNNAHFPEVMNYCARRAVWQPSCRTIWAGAVDAAINSMSIGTGRSTDNFPDLFAAVHARSPHATVYVLGYPRFFAKNRTSPCFTGVPDEFFTGPDMLWINQEIAKLDSTVKNAAGKFGFVFVDTYDSMNKHELCTNKPWLSAAQIPKAYSFHPNVDGQKGLAETLAGYVK